MLQELSLKDAIVDKIDDLKGRDIVTLDLTNKSNVADYFVVCTGQSRTHVRSIANYVAVELKKLGSPALGLEGEVDGEWVLIDFGDVVVHVMQEETRDFYQLEKLWG